MVSCLLEHRDVPRRDHGEIHAASHLRAVERPHAALIEDDVGKVCRVGKHLSLGMGNQGLGGGGGLIESLE